VLPTRWLVGLRRSFAGLLETLEVIPVQKWAGDFSFSVSSVPSVVRKSGFKLDFEHTIFVVKKIRDRKPSAGRHPPEETT